MTIRIVALRHAKALSEGYADDSLRPLSNEGKENQRKLTQILKEKGITPTLILSSPLLRAQETAQIATDLFGIDFLEESCLGIDFDKDALLAKISDSGQNTTIFLVGHAPSLGNFMNQLVGENILPYGLSISSAAIVDFDDTIGFGNGKFIDYFRA